MREPFRVGRVVGRSFSIWLRRLPVLLGLTLIAYAPGQGYLEALERAWPLPELEARRDGESRLEAVGGWLLELTPYVASRFLVASVFRDLSIALVITAVYGRLGSHPTASFRALLMGGLRRFPRVALVSLSISAIAAVVWMALWFAVWLAVTADLGLITLAVASVTLLPLLVLFLLSPYWAAVPAAASGEPGGYLRRSRGLTRGHRTRICAILLLLYGIEWGSARVVAIGAESMSWIARTAVGWAQDLLVLSLSAVLAAVGYHALRLEKEGVDVSKLKEIFG